MSLARSALFLLGYAAVLFVVAIPKGMVPPAFADVTWGSLASLGIVALTIAALRFENTTPPLRIAGGTGKQFVTGLALGVAVYLMTLAVISLTVGPLRIATPVTTPTLPDTVLVIAGLVALSCMEELGFRGYPLRALVVGTGEFTAVILTAVAFAGFHLLFGWALPTVVLGVLPSGILFGVAAVVSSGLALPIGLHAAVNITMWAVGEKGTPGFVSLTLEPSFSTTAGRITEVIGAAVPLLMSAALWRWYPRTASEATAATAGDQPRRVGDRVSR